MSIPSFSEWPDIPQRSAPEADFDAKMYALFQHFATTHRNEMLAFINFLENNSTVINGALNGTTIGLNTPAAGKFTTLLADSLGGAAVQSTATDATAGKLMKLATSGHGAFGLGGKLPASDNIDQFLDDGVTGWVRASSGAQGSRADFTSVLTMAQYDGIGTQVAFGIGNNSPLVSVRGDGGGGAPGPWFDLKTDYDVQSDYTDTTAGKLMKVGAFGLGEDVYTPLSNIDTHKTSGFYFGYGGAHGSPTPGTNPYPGFNGAFGLIVGTSSVGNADEYLWQISVPFTTTAGSLKWRCKSSSGGGWSPWEETITDKGGQMINGSLYLDGPMGIGMSGGAIGRLHIAHAAANVGWSFVAKTDDVNNQSGIWKDASNNMELALRDGTSDNSVATRIASDGNTYFGNTPVGIGTKYPLSTLHVVDHKVNGWASRVVAADLAYAGQIHALIAERAASPDFSFMRMHSGSGAGDREFELTGDGNGKCDGAWTGGGADYAEFFEWALAWIEWAKDWKANKGTLAGISVVLEGDKIRPAQDGETPIGVISANPSVVGDGDIDRWKGKYLRDDFGAYIWEDYEALSWTETVTETETVQEQATEAQEFTREVIEVVAGKAVKKTVTEVIEVPLFDEFPLVDEEGNDLGTHREPRMIEVQKETTKEVRHSYAADEVPEGVTVPEDAERVIQKRRKLNPEYDPSQPYIPRAERLEWDMVGLMGKLRLRKGQPVAPNWIKMRDVSAEVEEWLVK